MNQIVPRKIPRQTTKTTNRLGKKRITFRIIPKRFIALLVLVLVIGELAAGCNLTSGLKGRRVEDTSTPEVNLTQSFEFVQGTLSALATQTAQAAPPTATPIPPTPTPTKTATPATPTATNTLAITTSTPASSSSLSYEKIRFSSGATSTYIQKYISAGDRHQYRLRALSGQTMILTASSPENDVYLAVEGVMDERVLLSASSEVTQWAGTLPHNQEYLITLTTDNPDTYYFLSIEVPANIYFGAGAYSDTIEGFIDVDENFHPGVLTRVRYLARAFEGQTMWVDLTSNNLDDLSVGVVGEDDEQVYINYKVKNDGGEVDLPTTQGYYIDVYAVSGESTRFTLKLTIE